MTPEPAALLLRCACGLTLWDYSEGEWILRNRVLILDAATMKLVARCPDCRKRVPVPFLAHVQPLPAATPAPARRRVVGGVGSAQP